MTRPLLHTVYAALAAFCFLGALAVIATHVAAQEEPVSELVELLPAPPPSSTAKETDWSRWIAESMGGESEHQTYNQRRVDVLLHNRAIEVEWCKKEKIAEAIRQAQYYAASTGRPGAVVLLTGRDDYSREREVYDQAVQAAARSGVLAVSWLDIREPKLGVMCEHLGLVPTPAMAVWD